MPRVDEEFLSFFADLKIIFYGAGSIRTFATEEMWRRGVRVTSAAAANAESVVEFTVAQILLAVKNALFNERPYRATKNTPTSTATATSAPHSASSPWNG